MERLSHDGKAHREWLMIGLLGVFLLVVMPLLNTYPAHDSAWWVSDYSLNLFGKFLAYAILALGLDLIWGYTGILSSAKGSSSVWGPTVWGCT
jgi:urea transport system permease protein